MNDPSENVKDACLVAGYLYFVGHGMGLKSSAGVYNLWMTNGPSLDRGVFLVDAWCCGAFFWLSGSVVLVQS